MTKAHESPQRAAQRVSEFFGSLAADGFQRACIRCVASAARLTTDDVMAIAEDADTVPGLVVEVIEGYACPLCLQAGRSVAIRKDN